MTRVSVVMSVCNGGRYLTHAVDSILSQSFGDFEFIILNDGSTDGSGQIIGSFHDRRIKIAENRQTIGLTRSLNRGLSMARGEYVARMDADDISLPKRFECQVAFLDTHREVGVLGTAAQLIDRSGTKGEIIRSSTEHGFLRWLMCLVNNPIVHPSVMARRQWIEDVGGYDENMVTSQDYELWCRLSGRTRFANLADVHLFLRKHDENISNLRLKDGIEKVFEVNRRLVAEVLGGEAADAEMRSLWKFVFDSREILPREAKTAARFIRRLRRTFLDGGSMSPAEEAMVRRDAIERLKTLWMARGKKSWYRRLLAHLIYRR